MELKINIDDLTPEDVKKILTIIKNREDKTNKKFNKQIQNMSKS